LGVISFSRLSFSLGPKVCPAEQIRTNVVKLLGILILAVSLSSFLALFFVDQATARFGRGGIVGLVFSDFLMHYFGRAGAYVILLMLGLLSLPLIGEILVIPFFGAFFDRLLEHFEAWREARAASGGKKERAKTAARLSRGVVKEKSLPQGEPAIKDFSENRDTAQEKKEFDAAPLNIKIAKSKPETLKDKEPIREVSDEDYVLPSIDLLESPPPVSMRQMKEDLAENAKILEDTLSDFGLSVRVADIERGPVITRYELEPPPASRFKGL
jgi:S-DNA-T family DNA segregation ATPase FtsK/SpoIIIE